MISDSFIFLFFVVSIAIVLFIAFFSIAYYVVYSARTHKADKIEEEEHEDNL